MKEIRKKDEKALVAYIQEKREEVRSFRFGTAGASARNVRAIRAAKKEIARSLFELSARKLNTSNKSAK
jgi:ribosomal protein L29